MGLVVRLHYFWVFSLALLILSVFPGCIQNAEVQWTTTSSSSSETTSEETTPTRFVTIDNSDGSYVNQANVTSYTMSGTCSDDSQTVDVSLTGSTTGVLNFTSLPCSENVWSTGSQDLTSLTGSTISVSATHDSHNHSITLNLDLTGPSVANVTSSHADGSYTVGEDIPIDVTFSESVVVTGNPSVALNSRASPISFSTGSGTTTLSFIYDVTSGDTSAGLDYTSMSALTLNGGTIKDAAGNPANLMLPSPGAANSLSANKEIIIDTTAPAATISVTGLNNQNATDNNNISISLTSTETANTSMYITTDSTCSTDGTWAMYNSISSYPLASGSLGQYTLYVKVKDEAGNHSPCVASQSFYYETATVEPLWPVNGINWNDYVNNSNLSLSFFQISDTACSGSGSSPQNCYHGGEFRKVLVPGISSCAGLTITDSLDVFGWKCDDNGGAGPVYFYSAGFKRHKGLKDLIEASGWKDLSVAVSGGVTKQSVARPWWNNTVLPLADNSSASALTLTSGGTVYYLDSDRSTAGYNINADKISIVTLGTAKLSYSGANTANCSSVDGEGSGSEICLISAGGQKYLWLEGNFSAKKVAGTTSADYGILLVGARFSRLNQVKTAQAVITNLEVINSSANRFFDIVANSSEYIGIDFNNSSGNQASWIRASNNAAVGLWVYDNSNSNVFSRVLASNNFSSGIEIYDSSSNIVSAYSSMQNGYGVVIDASSGTTASFNTFHNGLIANTYTNGVLFTGDGTKSSNTFSQTASVGSHDRDYFLYKNDSGLFTGNLLHTDSSSCYINAGTDPGLGTACAAQGASDHNPVSGKSIANSFVAKVTNDDAENGSDSSGVKAFGSILDWVFFDNPYRSWGMFHGNTFPGLEHATNCASGETCQIWDWSLLSADADFLNRSNNGSTANPVWTSGSACPSILDGNYTLNDASALAFLKNAIEPANDPVGNNNGLCEANETCIYTPNFGMYQGSGAADDSCVFNPAGGLSGIRIYRHPQNGI